MSKPFRTDLCAFKRFLKKKGVLEQYKKELKGPARSHSYTWHKLAKQSKERGTGLYDIINCSLCWARCMDDSFGDQCQKLNSEWNQYWEKTWQPVYNKRFGKKKNSNPIYFWA